MGECWTIFNVDRQAAYDFTKLPEFFWDDYYEVFISLLIAPVIPPHFKSKPIVSKPRILEVQNDSLVSPATLLTLPFELLLAIAEELADDYLALICYSLTCVTMWELTHPVRYRVLCSELKYKSWAGSRIVLLGQYARCLPKGMLTAKEIELTLDNFEDSEEEDSDEEKEGLDKKMEYRLARNFCYKVPFTRASLTLNLSIYNNTKFWKHRSYHEIIKFDRQYRSWFEFRWKEFMPSMAEGDRWMVRNFTKREFVAKSSRNHLSQVVFFLVGCSSYEPYVLGGNWAGNRIDITFASIHEQEHKDESDWKDITAEVKYKLEVLARELDQDLEF
ncbi:hypothetical protein GGU10DRAFT_390757 [Lentinula aff. detonsa]|uniref:Uncharacterized protein n=1 Tax=Lentinula aff. detonsa TaxID=2804958 RepID=A0AA38KLS1_9AGAR|nr:hypothetical protein GGU10DRAFT_390757 [Lentinula aff. detonsa]